MLLGLLLGVTLTLSLEHLLLLKHFINYKDEQEVQKNENFRPEQDDHN